MLAASTPALCDVGRRLGRRREGADGTEPRMLYEDGDGRASEESQARFSTTLPRLVGLVAVLAGLAVADGLAVLNTVQAGRVQVVESWVRVGAWVCGFWTRAGWAQRPC